MYKVKEKYGEKYATIKMELKLDIFLGDSENVPEGIDLDFIRDRLGLMDNADFADAVLGQLDLERDLLKR